MTQPLPTPAEQVPLDQPLYGASLPQAVRRVIAKYAVFSGRASRSEYWWWSLVVGIIAIVFSILWTAVSGQAWLASREYSLIEEVTGVSGLSDLYPPTTLSVGAIVVIVLYAVFALVTLVPNLSVLWRRLHDAGYSGLFYLLTFIPLVGPIIVLVLTLLPPNPSGRRFDRPRFTV